MTYISTTFFIFSYFPPTFPMIACDSCHCVKQNAKQNFQNAAPKIVPLGARWGAKWTLGARWGQNRAAGGDSSFHNFSGEHASGSLSNFSRLRLSHRPLNPPPFKLLVQPSQDQHCDRYILHYRYVRGTVASTCLLE